MTARLPANWRPGAGGYGPEREPQKAHKLRAARGQREEPRADLDMAKIGGEWLTGEWGGKMHRWKCLGYTYISGCGVQFFRAGWTPGDKVGIPSCERCEDVG